MNWLNPFKAMEEKKIERQQKEAADFEMSAGLTTGQVAVMDRQMVLENKSIIAQLNKWQQDRTPAMRELFLRLSGCQYDEREDRFVELTWNKGFVSLLGAAKLVNFIEPLDHNVMLANWSEKNVILTMRDAIAHPLRRFIFMNYKQLGLKLEHAEYVFWLIINTVEPTYWRGWNNGERAKDSKIHTVNEVINPYFQQKKNRLFGIEV